MHPRHKLQYFKKLKWRAAWIREAEDLTRQAWDRSYATRVVERVEEAAIPSDAVSTALEVYLLPSLLIHY